MPVEHFKNKEAERRNLAYRHMHGIPYTATTAVVAGKAHKVQHSTSPGREKIDVAQRRKRDMSHVAGNSKKRSY
jgi:hypothetical protein